MKTRRQFVRQLAVGGAALSLWDVARAAGTPPHPVDALLPGLGPLTPEEKIRRITALTEASRIHPSGIFVCMPKVTATGLRPVELSDFDGMDRFSENFGLRFKSLTDFFNNENSITTSGSHLAAQAVRFTASGDPAALVAARRAYASLRRIYGFGVADGRPGFMGKPYHFEYSSHTTGDQYLHMLWGLWTFYPLATVAEQAEIREMVRACADHFIAEDYSVHFRDGRGWNMRLDPSDYNAIMAALQAAAFRFTGDRRYRTACEFVMQTGKWRTRRRLDLTIERVRAGKWQPAPWDRLVGETRRPDEFVQWEDIQHCQFTAISAVILHESVPDLFTADDLAQTVGLWWQDYTVGFDRAVWGYLYWFLVSSRDRSWRRCPITPRVPREQWIGGHPMLSYASEWIYGDCLARFLWTAMIVARHCPAHRDEAATFAGETLRRLEPRHLLWISDPDGHQVPPELRYFTEFLSSEVPENLIATYWEGRRQRLWT